jgi:hypothetical protein
MKRIFSRTVRLAKRSAATGSRSAPQAQPFAVHSRYGDLPSSFSAPTSGRTVVVCRAIRFTKPKSAGADAQVSHPPRCWYIAGSGDFLSCGRQELIHRVRFCSILERHIQAYRPLVIWIIHLGLMKTYSAPSVCTLRGVNSASSAILTASRRIWRQEKSRRSLSAVRWRAGHGDHLECKR